MQFLTFLILFNMTDSRGLDTTKKYKPNTKLEISYKNRI